MMNVPDAFDFNESDVDHSEDFLGHWDRDRDRDVETMYRTLVQGARAQHSVGLGRTADGLTHGALGARYTIPTTYVTHDSAAGRMRRLLLRQPVPKPSTRAPDPTTTSDAKFISFTDFDSDAALLVVARATRYPRPTGPIDIAELLIHVLLYLPLHSWTLVQVSAVSRAWRAATEHLPHWCLLRPLFEMEPNVRLAAATAGVVIDDSHSGDDVINRSMYVAVMQRRAAVRFAVAAKARNQHAVAIRWRRYGPLAQILAAGCVYALWERIIAGASSLLTHNDELTFILVVALSSLLFLLSLLHLFPHGVRVCTLCVTQHQRNVRSRTFDSVSCILFVTIALWAFPMAFATFCTEEARIMALQPRIVYGFDSQHCQPATSISAHTRPTYVQIARPREWIVRPWLTPGAAPQYRLPLSGQPRPLCDLANETTEAWAQWAASPMADDEQCWDVVIPAGDVNVTSIHTSYTYVLLYPSPSVRAACPEAGPVALSLKRDNAPFGGKAGTLEAWLDSSLGLDESLTTFRVNRPRYLPQDLHDVWYDAVPMNTAWPKNTWVSPGAATGTYLWQPYRIPLILPTPAQGPEALHDWWETRTSYLSVIVPSPLVIIALLSLLPSRTLSSQTLQWRCIQFALGWWIASFAALAFLNY
jgi:hypothetical protein